MTLTIAATAHESSAACPAVKLTVTASAVAPKAVPANTVLTITRVHQDGSEHRVILPSTPRVIPTTWTGFDYHAPYSEGVTYRVDAAGSSSTTTGYAMATRCWLVSSSDPTLSVLPDGIRAITDRAIASRSVLLPPIGGRKVSIGEGASDGMTGTIVVKVADERPLRALLADDSPILINTPGDGWALSWHWVQWKAQAWRQVTDHQWAPYSLATITWEDCGDPDGDLAPVWTIKTMRDYLVANGKTAGDVDTIWSTVGNLAIDTRV